MRTLDFRYIVMRSGADYGQIWPAGDSQPTIRMNEADAIKTSLSGEFLPTVYGFDGEPITGASVNWLSDQIRPELIIDGQAHPCGVFLPATVTEERSEDGADLLSYSVQAYDRCWQVRDNKTETTQYFAAGVNYLAAVEQLLTAAGIALISSTVTSATLTEAREDWNIGTSYLDIINQLLSEINYNPLWFNEDGLAVLEPATVVTPQSIDHTLDASDPDNLILPGYRRTSDIYSAPNVFYCVCSNADKSGPMTARSENTNPQSPISIPRRGRSIMKVVRVDNIASQEELQAYADRLRNESMITAESISIQTGLLPGFGVRDVTAVQYGDDLFVLCIERVWTMRLGPGGSMTHELEKVVVNLD